MYTDDYSRETSGAEQDREWMKRQLSEAIAAGERAVTSLEAARDKLNSAKNWGIFDLLGGGFLASMIKHSEMRGASEDLQRAADDLAFFQDELQDVNVTCDIDLDTEGFLSFADVFMDSFVADALMQDKIVRARKQADEAIKRTGSIVRALKEKLRTM